MPTFVAASLPPGPAHSEVIKVMLKYNVHFRESSEIDDLTGFMKNLEREAALKVFTTNESKAEHEYFAATKIAVGDAHFFSGSITDYRKSEANSVVTQDEPMFAAKFGSELNPVRQRLTNYSDSTGKDFSHIFRGVKEEEVEKEANPLWFQEKVSQPVIPCLSYQKGMKIKQEVDDSASSIMDQGATTGFQKNTLLLGFRHRPSQNGKEIKQEIGGFEHSVAIHKPVTGLMNKAPSIFSPFAVGAAQKTKKQETNGFEDAFLNQTSAADLIEENYDETNGSVEFGFLVDDMDKDEAPEEVGDTPSLKCTNCKRRFKSHSGLGRHVLLVHAKQKHECDVCHRTFTRNRGLNLHRRIHTEEGSFECDQCDKKFHYKNSLRYHRNLHGEKRFECDQCEMKFFSSGSLKSHSYKHTDERPIGCVYCGKRFKCKRSLTVHVKALHANLRAAGIV